jgi:formamidopyrimidine-DNA glycosylase
VPELPEVETIARGLNTRVAGDAIESVWIGSRKQPLKSPAALIASTLEGKRILKVHRAGKHIVFDLEGESSRSPAAPKKGKRAVRGQKRPAASLHTAQWIVHLGMTGRLVVCEPAAEIAKHTHLIAKLAPQSGALSCPAAAVTTAPSVKNRLLEVSKIATNDRESSPGGASRA